MGISILTQLKDQLKNTENNTEDIYWKGDKNRNVVLLFWQNVQKILRLDGLWSKKERKLLNVYRLENTKLNRFFTFLMVKSLVANITDASSLTARNSKQNSVTMGLNTAPRTIN